jgi:hypothetical protein
MTKIVTVSALQKSIGKIESFVAMSWTVIVNRGNPTAVLVPYFEDNDEALDRYMEDCELSRNKIEIQQELIASKKSGLSDLRL